MSLTGALLARDKVDRYRSMGAFGKPVYQSHVQLRAMLLAQRKPHLANYFARPVYDADLGELQWVAEMPGAARRLGELGLDERARAVDAMARIHAELLGIVAGLRGKEGGGAAFASLFEQAMKVPAQGDFVHVVGEQPVIAFWGFGDATGASLDPAAQAPLRAPSAHAAGPLETPPAEQPPPIPLGATPPPRPRRRWWLWLLLALVLLALMLFLARSCVEPSAVSAGRQVGPALTIPPGALERGDLSFLDGEWQLGEERLMEYKDNPNNVVGSGRNILRFGPDGQGRSVMTERQRHSGSQRAGTPYPECGGALRARTDGKKLFFEQAPCEVPGQPGQGFNGSQHECVRSPEGRTTCYNVNDDGHRWEAPLRRLE